MQAKLSSRIKHKSGQTWQNLQIKKNGRICSLQHEHCKILVLSPETELEKLWQKAPPPSFWIWIVIVSQIDKCQVLWRNNSVHEENESWIRV